jgi:hypothetical protein
MGNCSSEWKRRLSATPATKPSPGGEPGREGEGQQKAAGSGEGILLDDVVARFDNLSGQ